MDLGNLIHCSRDQLGRANFSDGPTPQRVTASSMVGSSYTSATRTRNQRDSDDAHRRRPPSPPMEEAWNCSLPPISSLLGLNDVADTQEQRQQAQQKFECRPSSGHFTCPSPSSISRDDLPPTPPMYPDSWFDRRLSSSTVVSTRSSAILTPDYYPTLSTISAKCNREPPARRRCITESQREDSSGATSILQNQSIINSSQHTISPKRQSIELNPPGLNQPTTPQAYRSGLQYQRAFPQQISPPSMPLPIMIAPSSGMSPWQHHHYISPSSTIDLPQAQDRYICPTCNKAFSRPSSLKIHSHSHTGEKPFMCSRQGCGKTFSVRSNMKRHERGCHTFGSSFGDMMEIRHL